MAIPDQLVSGTPTLPIDACFNPETGQLYLRYAGDPPGTFVQQANIENSIYRLAEGLVGPIKLRKE